MVKLNKQNKIILGIIIINYFILFLFWLVDYIHYYKIQQNFNRLSKNNLFMEKTINKNFNMSIQTFMCILIIFVLYLVIIFKKSFKSYYLM